MNNTIHFIALLFYIHMYGRKLCHYYINTTYYLLSSLRPFYCFNRDTTGFTDWTFSTVRCWGETAEGQYTLKITDYSKTLQSTDY